MANEEDKSGQIELTNENERLYFESLVRSDYERSHPDETWNDLKHRARFSKEDKGLLRDWTTLATQRAIARKRAIAFDIAA